MGDCVSRNLYQNKECNKMHEQTYLSCSEQVIGDATVKPDIKGHPSDRQNMVFINEWSLLRSHFL